MNRSTIVRALHQAELRKSSAKIVFSTISEADRIEGSDDRLFSSSTVAEVYQVFTKNAIRIFKFQKRLEELDMFKEMRIHPHWRLFYYGEIEGALIVRVVSYRKYAFRIQKVTDNISRLIVVETEGDDQWPVIECSFLRGDNSALSLKAAIENCRSKIDDFVRQLKKGKANGGN